MDFCCKKELDMFLLSGYGGLTLAVEGPSKVTIQTEELEDGTCGVSFQPTEPGAYTVSVKFADEHVPGSPFKLPMAHTQPHIQLC